MKNEAEIHKLMELLYGEGMEDPAQQALFLQEHPELAQELADLQEVRSALQGIPSSDAPFMPFFMPTPAVPKVRKLSWPYWAAASVALVVFGFLLAKIQLRFEAGAMTIAFGNGQNPAQIQTEHFQPNALTAADTQAIQELVRSELAYHYTQLEQTITAAQVNLRKENDIQRLQLVNKLQEELVSLNSQQQKELTALVASSQAENLGKLVTAMNEANFQQQEKIKWVLQEGFIDWNIKREKDLDRIKEEFNKVYAQVHYQKQEQDRFNRVIIQSTNN